MARQTLAKVDYASPPQMLTGTLLIPANDCQYSTDVNESYLLRVDFDKRAIGPDGLYLVEILNPAGVEWRGCRRFQKMPGLHMDVSGAGEWRPFSLEAHNMRVVGYVEQVYKPV
jgi:hypothetical protein